MQAAWSHGSFLPAVWFTIVWCLSKKNALDSIVSSRYCLLTNYKHWQARQSSLQASLLSLWVLEPSLIQGLMITLGSSQSSMKNCNFYWFAFQKRSPSCPSSSRWPVLILKDWPRSCTQWVLHTPPRFQLRGFSFQRWFNQMKCTPIQILMFPFLS